MDECGEIRAAILDLLNSRELGKTICPSEPARAVFSPEAWRQRMPLVREVAAEMAGEGIIEVCQKGISVSPGEARGPIRLRRTT